ncbi:hypothetical protein ACQKWADRAFT_255335 [Trichoderma austrokoningii]
MSLIHQPFPEIASSPPPSPAEQRPHHGKTRTSLETRRALLPPGREAQDGLFTLLSRLSIVSAASEAPCDAMRCDVLPADGTDYESRRTHGRTQQNFLPAVWARSGLGGGKTGTRRILALVSH